jgi:hypothetical protein
MTPEEDEVLNLLGQAWNKFNELPILHHSDRGDFAYAIHAAQNIVLARAGLRATGITDRVEPDIHDRPAPPPKKPREGPGYISGRKLDA